MDKPKPLEAGTEVRILAGPSKGKKGSIQTMSGGIYEVLVEGEGNPVYCLQTGEELERIAA